MVQSSREWGTFDVVKGMLALVPEGTSIPASEPVLHSALHRLSHSLAYRTLLSDYVFRRRSYFPFCSEFQTDLTNLEMAGHLSNPNPGLEGYELRPKLRLTFEKYTRRLFSDPEFKALRALSSKFMAFVNEEAARV